MNEIIQKLEQGLPDDRILKRVSKATVISDSGTPIVLKDRGYVGYPSETVYLYESLGISKIEEFIKTLDHKELVITSEAYRNNEIRDILKRI